MNNIIINWRKSDVEFPEPGKEIIVLSANHGFSGVGQEVFETWLPIAINDETGFEYDSPYNFKELAAKDGYILVNKGNGFECRIDGFVEEKFLWIYPEEYNKVLDYLGFEKTCMSNS